MCGLTLFGITTACPFRWLLRYHGVPATTFNFTATGLMFPDTTLVSSVYIFSAPGIFKVGGDTITVQVTFVCVCVNVYVCMNYVLV